MRDRHHALLRVVARRIGVRALLVNVIVVMASPQLALIGWRLNRRYEPKP